MVAVEALDPDLEVSPAGGEGLLHLLAFEGGGDRLVDLHRWHDLEGPAPDGVGPQAAQLPEAGVGEGEAAPIELDDGQAYAALL